MVNSVDNDLVIEQNESLDSICDKPKRLQLREMTLVCYLDENTFIDRLNLLDKDEYAFIVHDCDTDINGEIKKYHIHCYLYLPKKKDINVIAKMFDIEPNLISKVNSKIGALKYFLHYGFKDKYSYPFESLKTNIRNVDKMIFNQDLDSLAFGLCLDMCNLDYSYRQICCELAKLGYLKWVQKHAWFIKALQKDD